VASAREILDLWRRGDFWDAAFAHRPWPTSLAFGVLLGAAGGGIGIAIGETNEAALGIAGFLAVVGLLYFRFWTGPRALRRREREKQKLAARSGHPGSKRRRR
jgi:uncharacterized membrane protein YphA (DoxX/SURF4 family)